MHMKRRTAEQQQLPIRRAKYVVVSRETATAIRLHEDLVWDSSAKLTDALAPCDGLHIDHQAALMAINDILIAYRYIGRLVEKATSEGIFTDGNL
jgi:hypothetical protein